MKWNESHRAVALVLSVHVYCTEDVVQCVWSSASSRVQLRLFCGWGAADRLTRQVSSLPTLIGGPSAVAPTTWTDLLGTCAERVPDCSSYLFRIPWVATAVGCQFTRARLLPSETSLTSRPLARGLKASSLLKLTPSPWSERLLSLAGDRLEIANSQSSAGDLGPLLPSMFAGKKRSQ